MAFRSSLCHKETSKNWRLLRNRERIYSVVSLPPTRLSMQSCKRRRMRFRLRKSVRRLRRIAR